MSSNRAKTARTFSDTYYTSRSSPVVMVNRRRTPEVVCQVQGHNGGFDDAIEVTLKQKRSPRRMTIVYHDDDSDSEEADVVVRTRAVSRHRKGKSAKHQQVEESSSSPTARASSRHQKGKSARRQEIEDSSSSSSSSNSDSFSDETIVEQKNTKKKVNAKKARGSRKKRNHNVSQNNKHEEKPHETVAQGASTTPLASVRSVIWQPLYVTVPAASAPPTPANYINARVEPDIRPVSTPAQRRTPEPEPTSRRPLSVLARRFGHRSPWMRLIGIKNDNSREPDTRPRASKSSNNGHHRSHAGSPTEAESSGDCKSGSSLEGYRHQCYGCDRFRSEYWQDERRPRKGEMIKPSLCGSCRQKLRSAYNKVHGPRGEDLSTLFWCRVCGFRRSSRFHRQHREPSETFSSLNNTCNICVEDKKRSIKIRQGKRRAIEHADPMDESHIHVASPGGGEFADRTFSSGSALWTAPNDTPCKDPGEKQKAIPNRPRSPYHRPTVDPETESMAEEDARKAQQSEKTLRRSRNSVGDRSAIPASDHPEVLTDATIRAPAREQPEKDRTASGSTSGYKEIKKSRVPGHEQPKSNRQTSGSSSGSKISNKSRVPGDEKLKSSRQASGCEQPQNDRKTSGSSSSSKKNNNTRCSIHVITASSRRSSHAGSSKYSTTAKARDRTSAQSTTSKAKPAAPESHDNSATKPSKGTDSSSSSGFCNNSADSWARLDIDNTLRDAIAMDPQELAARQARLMGKKNEVSPAPSLCFEGPRVWEIHSDDEA